MDDTESTTTSNEENNLCDNPTRDTLAEGLMGLLKPSIDSLDERVRATRISQIELKQQIDSLSEELKKLNVALDSHPNIDAYVKKLNSCRSKVTVVLNVLQASQDRLNEIKRMVKLESNSRAAILAKSEIRDPEPSTSGVAPPQGTIN